MSNIKNASWISWPEQTPDAALTFTKEFEVGKKLRKALIEVSALGVYTLSVNGRQTDIYPLAPGWTNNAKRVQYQTSDVTALIKKKNSIKINLGRGWRMHRVDKNDFGSFQSRDTAVIAALELIYNDGSSETVCTDDSWSVRENRTRFNNMYNGETYDCTYEEADPVAARVVGEIPTDILIPQEGEIICEHERIPGQSIFVTPKGETVVDFGQEITGYVSFKYEAPAGEKMTLKHFEVLDKDGNVYTENLRSAQQLVTVVNDGKLHEFKPSYTFYGFRYIKIDGFPATISPRNFTAIAVYSNIRKTGTLKTFDPLFDRFISNVEWGQKGNFLDVPTDCPQRDERLGWTGDAQVFCRTACYQTDVKRFFTKWLNDCDSEFCDEYGLPHVVPLAVAFGGGSAAWADCCTVIPWTLYEFYGDKELLAHQYPLMKKWVDHVIRVSAKEDEPDDFDKSRDPYLWNNGGHFGDWLALDIKDNNSVGATDTDFIACEMSVISLGLLIKAQKALGIDPSEYVERLGKVKEAIKKEYFTADGTVRFDPTQSAYVLALYTDTAPDRQKAASELIRLLDEFGHMTTGFVATQYLLPVLLSLGEKKRVFDLLKRKEYPSWLYPVTMGATTVWERWDGIKPDGSFQDAGMNSFNHYAYGAVAAFVYEYVAGIRTTDQTPGFEDIRIEPLPDPSFGHVFASVDTVKGLVSSEWTIRDDKVSYVITIPGKATGTALIAGEEKKLKPGRNVFTSAL